MTRHANLSSPAVRSKLKIRAAPHYGPLGAGTHLGYRRMRGAGSWILRRYCGSEKYVAEAFALADDLGPADGVKILTFHQAQDKARELAKAHAELERLKADGPPLTVGRACDEYADGREGRWVNELSGSKHDARRRLARLPKDLLETPLALLTVDTLATARPEIDDRTVHDLRAALNAAARRYRDRLPPTLRDIIRDGLASPGSARDAPSREIVALSEGDVKRLVAAAQEVDREDGWDGGLFRIVLALASTGSRFSQIARCRVADVQAGQRRLMVPPSAKGKSDNKAARIAVPIGDDVIKALTPATVGRLGNEPLFTRPGWKQAGVGQWEKAEIRPWRSSAEFARPWRLIIERVGLSGVTPYHLRHAAIVRSLRLGLPVQLVAKLFDTSATMIQKNYSASIVDALGELAEKMVAPLAPVAPSPIAAVRR
jgi:integrase